MLDQQSAGAPVPAPRRALAAGCVVARHGEPDERRQLLGLAEIGQRRLGEALAVERDDALVALHVAARIDGHGEMAAAEQLAPVGDRPVIARRPASRRSAHSRAGARAPRS